MELKNSEFIRDVMKVDVGTTRDLLSSIGESIKLKHDLKTVDVPTSDREIELCANTDTEDGLVVCLLNNSNFEEDDFLEKDTLNIISARKGFIADVDETFGDLKSTILSGNSVGEYLKKWYKKHPEFSAKWR